MAIKNTYGVQIFILLILSVAVLDAVFYTVRMVNSPNNISVPIAFEVKEAGNVPESDSVKFSITKAYGMVHFGKKNSEGRICCGKGYSPTILSMILYHFNHLSRMLIYIFIIFQLKKMIDDARLKNPFHSKNSTRLKWIGLAIITSWVISLVINIYTGLHFEGTMIQELSVENVNSKFPNNGSLFSGLLILFLSEIFSIGSSMKEEAELTI